MKYHKIQSVFKRDPDNNHKTFLEGHFSLPEFGYLQYNDWIFTEKVDGTNIRIYCDPVNYEVGSSAPIPDQVRIAGRTDRTQIPPKLYEALVPIGERLRKDGFTNICLYGEGYGAGIQKGGGNYRDTPGFVLFDVMIGGVFLDRFGVEDVADELGISVVPVRLVGTLHDGIELCRAGFQSDWRDFRAEGLVGTPRVRLFNHKGERIITKIKCKDFDHNDSKEGDCENN